jgi:hypothetical protein
MSDYVLNDTIRIDALAKLPSQFVDGPNWNKLVKLFADEIQAAENAIADLILLRSLEEARGVNLDQYGILVGEYRDSSTSLADRDYKSLIRCRILANYSNGELDLLLKILSRASGGVNVRIYEYYPASISMHYHVSEPLSEGWRARITDIMNDARSVGVSIIFIAEAPLEYFGFADDTEASGFSSSGFGSGAVFATII